TSKMNRIVDQHASLFSKQEIESVAAMDEEARMRSMVAEEVSSKVSVTSLVPSQLNVVSMFVAQAAPSSVVVLILVGVPVLVLSRLGKERKVTTTSAVALGVSFLVCLIVTVLLFGLAPSGVVPRSVQAWGFTLLLIAGPVALIAWLGWLWLRRRTFKLSLFSLLWFVSISGVLFRLAAAAELGKDSFDELPFDLSIPTRDWNGLDATSWAKALSERSKGLWTAIQWQAYHGPTMTLLVWAGLIGLLIRARGRQQEVEPENAAVSRRVLFRGWARSFGSGCLTLSACVAVLYLILAPNMLWETERYYQEQMAFCRNPPAHWDDVERVATQVKSDQATMEQIRAMVQAQIADDLASDDVR
ncbi:MAG: hypothetical protein AAFX06_30825, partial [Planctomycetota bacterium]